MNPERRPVNPNAKGFIQLVIFVLILLLFVRLFPLLLRVVNAAGLSIITFWWVILVFALAGVFIWALRRVPRENKSRENKRKWPSDR